MSKVSISPSSTSISISLRSSSSFSSLSSSSSASSSAFYSARVIYLRLVQSDAKCPSPLHLKHLRMPLGRFLGVGCWAWLCCGVGVFWGMGGVDAVGLGVEEELPLFTVCSWYGGEGHGKSGLVGCFLFLCCSTL